MLVFDFSVTPAKLSLLRPGGEADKIKNTAANVLFARTNAAVSVVPPKLPAHRVCQSLLCALPVESTAAITSGARLPLLPAMPQHPGVQGEAHGGSFRPGHLRGSHLPALSGRGRLGLTFPVQRFFCLHCITAFCPCQHSRNIFVRFAPAVGHFVRSGGTIRTKRCPHTAT